MSINRTPANDHALARATLDPDFWLQNAFDNLCGGDEAKLQELYDARTSAQMQADGYSDAAAYLAANLPTLKEQDDARTAAEAARPRYATADEAKLAMITWINAFEGSVTGQTSDLEPLSWTTKEDAARAVVAGTATPEQVKMIDEEVALVPGDTAATLATAIIKKADLYRKIAPRITGLRRATTAALDAEPDPAKYEAILAAAQSQAVAMAGELGITI